MEIKINLGHAEVATLIYAIRAAKPYTYKTIWDSVTIEPAKDCDLSCATCAYKGQWNFSWCKTIQLEGGVCHEWRQELWAGDLTCHRSSASASTPVGVGATHAKGREWGYPTRQK